MNNFFKAVVHATRGLKGMLRSERNFKIQVSAFFLASGLGFFLSITKMEWLFLLLVSALVLSLEIINSSIEKLCDKIEPNQNEKIKIIKDTAAAAVLVAAAFALIIGLMIFVPYFFTQE